MKHYIKLLLIFISMTAHAQTPPKFTISGTAGVTYDGYGLITDPNSPNFYRARKPWHLVRFNFSPTMSFGDFKLPFDLNFSPMRTNFGGVPFGFGNLPGFPKQTLKQWLTNPMNSIGINPSYKWAELQLGTQYLKYSDLSTGDIGAFGYGFSLKPSNYVLKFFRGTTQQAYEPFIPNGAPQPFLGAFKRVITMAQVGLGQEGKYFAGFNVVKGSDFIRSIRPLLGPTLFTPKAQDNLIISFVTKFATEKGWYGQAELANTYRNRDIAAFGPSPLVKDFKPLFNSNLSSFRDHAAQAGFGKKNAKWDLGGSMKWLGAGYNTMGYPFTQNDRLEYSVNTRFNLWKDKININSNIGQRFGNWSRALGPNRTKQIIANANVNAQIDDHLNINANYNNFGFTAPALGGGIKNVGNDLGINPTYTWNTEKMSNLVSASYSWNKYDETTFLAPFLTSNNTHTGLLMYVPTFFNKPNISPDFSVMYFRNKSTVPTDLQIVSASTGLTYNFPKQKLSLKGQLNYNIITINPTTPSNNLLATIGVDYKVSKKISWNTSFTANLFKYGNELSTISPLLGAKYIESTGHTSLQYRF
jgi:hypothetical protein